MPVPAAGLAEVLVGDPHPAVLLGLGDHPLKQLAVAVLDVTAVAEQTAHFGDACEQAVAHALQLGGREQSRPAGRGDVVDEPGAARESVHEQIPELCLEAGYLAAQLDARGALVDVQKVGETSR